jgi:lipid A 4'-phosphatase
MKPAAAFLAAFLAAALVFTLAPGVDLWASGLFYRSGEGFFLKDWAPVRLLYLGLPYLTHAVILLALAATVALVWRRRPLLGLDRKRLLFVVLSLAIGPGIVTNTLLKDNWGRARPSQVTEFGGGKSFTPALLPANQCERNCSFVAGHPAMGFYLVSFALLVPAGRRRRAAVGAALAVGAAVGLARIAQGGHFLSDVVFYGLFTTAIAWLLHRWIVERDLLRRLPELLATPARRLGLFSAATFAAVGGSIVWIDKPLAYWFKAHEATFGPVFRVVTQLGVSTGFLIGAAVLFVALRAASRMARFAAIAERLHAWSYLPVFVFVSIAASGLTVNLLKAVFGRARPKLLFAHTDYYFGWWGFQADYWSFPSGHAATIVALVTALYFLWPRWLALYVLVGAVVALSRVVIAAHYLSDVLMASYIAIVMTAYVRLVFARSGIPLEAARAGRLGEAPAASWRERLGLRRLVSDSP